MLLRDYFARFPSLETGAQLILQHFRENGEFVPRKSSQTLRDFSLFADVYEKNNHS